MKTTNHSSPLAIIQLVLLVSLIVLLFTKEGSSRAVDPQPNTYTSKSSATPVASSSEGTSQTLGKQLVSAMNSEPEFTFGKPEDPALADLPQRFVTNAGAHREGDEFIDQTGAHHWYRKPRPFEVIHETDAYQWTSEDGLNEEVIRQLANNDGMVEFLKEEDALARQLVYTTPLTQQHLGEAYNNQRDQVVLPGLDGEEITIAVDRVEEFSDGANREDEMAALIVGTVVGNPNSLVEISVDGEGYSIGIQTPERTFEIINREPGEFIVSQIDLVAQAENAGGCDCDETSRLENRVGTIRQ